MMKGDKIKMNTERRYLSMEDKRLIVSQDNRIIQKIGNDTNEKRNITKQSFILDTYQKKLVLLMISHLKPNDTEFPIENISFSDYMNLMNISKGGKTYDLIHQSISTLMGMSFCIETKPKVYEYYHWLSSGCKVDEENKTISLKFDNGLKPFLLGKTNEFTAYELGFITNLKKKYSCRLFEYLRSYAGQGQIYISFENFCAKIIDNKYSNITDIERYVIFPAIEEINRTTDINVSAARKMVKGTRKKRTAGWHFSIHIKSFEDRQKIMADWNIDLDTIAMYEEYERPKFKEREDCRTEQIIDEEEDCPF